MAELLNVGKHCDFQGCNQLDFLPVKCGHCKNVFCKEHFSYLNHGCDSWNALSENNPNIVSNVQTYNCNYLECEKIEETSIICPKCNENFCMVHRLEKDHRCGYIKPEHMPKTAELVTQIVEKHQQENKSDINQVKKPKVLNAKAQKTAAKVQLMKLKQKSAGQKSIPMNDRAYFRIHLPLSKISTIKASEKTKGVFVSQSWCFGKVLDVISDLCGVENKNNVGGENKIKLRLFKHANGELLATENFNILLGDMLKSEEVLNGDTLILEYLETDDINNSSTSLDIINYKL